ALDAQARAGEGRSPPACRALHRGRNHVMRANPWTVAACALPLLALALPAPTARPAEEEAKPTRKFEVKEDRPYLGGKRIDLWGLRCGNALMSDAVTERHVRNLDNMVAHGINCVGVYVQGSNPGWPDEKASKN